MKRIALIFGLFFMLGNAWAQQRTVVTQYMFNPLLYNPAYAGAHGQVSLTAFHRDQWVNLPGAPQTTMFSAHTGVYRRPIGVGFFISQETIGVHNNFGMYGSYSYQIKNKFGEISMGLMAGFDQLYSDYTKLDLLQPDDPNLTGVVSKFLPNFGVGAMFTNKRGDLQLGFSVPYLLNNKINNVADALSEARQKRLYYFTASKLQKLQGKFSTKLAGFLRAQEGAPLSADFTAMFIYDDKVSLGGSYRTEDSFSILFHLGITPQFYIGYAYDINYSDLAPFNRGSHEFMLNYRFKIEGLNKFIECPSYFMK